MPNDVPNLTHNIAYVKFGTAINAPFLIIKIPLYIYLGELQFNPCVLTKSHFFTQLMCIRVFSP